MTLSPGKRDIDKVAKAIEQVEDLDEAAKIATELAFELYEAKAKFTCVGELFYGPDGYAKGPDKPKVALGWYSTEKKAADAGYSLSYGPSSHEQWRAWVLPVHHGTPAEFHKGRKREDVSIDEEVARKVANVVAPEVERLKKLREENADDD